MTSTVTKPVDRQALIGGARHAIAALEDTRQRLAPAATRGEQKALDERTRLATEIAKFVDYIELQEQAMAQDLADAEAERRRLADEIEQQRRERQALLWGDSGRKRLYGAWNAWLAAGEQIVSDYVIWRAEYNQVSGNVHEALDVGKQMAGRLQTVMGKAFNEPVYFGHNGYGLEPLPGPDQPEPAPVKLAQPPDRFVPQRHEPSGPHFGVWTEDTRPGTVLLTENIRGDKP